MSESTSADSRPTKKTLNTYKTPIKEGDRLEKHKIIAAENGQKIYNTDTPEKEIVKHTIKDSVFTNLFQDKKYLIQLYQALHPEDKEITENRLTDITIRNVLTDNVYNDLGFMVDNRLMILVEAQSTWTMNIIIRALMYLVQTYLNSNLT